MPKKLDLSNVVASTGDFEAIPEGAYVLEVTEVRDDVSKEYIELVFDIAEGPHKGAYADAWAKEHPYAHRAVMSYKETAAGLLKNWLNVLTESNPGFDAEAAYCGSCDNPALLGLFVGKRFGMSMLWDYWTEKDGVREPLKNPRPDWMHARVCSVQSVMDGSAKPPKRRERNTPPEGGAAPSSPAAVPSRDTYEDIPF